MKQEATALRKHIFLSHATPEDNEFTRWLAGKLTIAGYSVWYDLDQLKSGDYFWDKIERAIRNDSIRMIAIVSDASYVKNGVRNEWDLGMTIEKQIHGFLIPVRIDNFDFNQLPITIHRKNVIDFYQGWHLGLSQLLNTLEDSQVEKCSSSNLASAKAWLPTPAKSAINWVDRQETLESNWLPIIALPSAIETTRILGSERKIQITNTTRELPWFEYGDQIVGFAPRKDLVEMFKETVMLSPMTAVDTESFISGGITWGENRVFASDARNRVVTLVRQAWDLKMEKLGLKQYELSNRQLIWYVPSGLVPKDKVEFLEANGKRRKKQLTGTSEKLKVNWHYAVSMHPVLEGIRRIELRAHIVFTDSEGQFVESARMHQLRRRFCRNWWNDRWRGFLCAFLALAAQGTDTISLPVGEGRSIQIEALPLTFLAPKGLSDLVELNDDDDVVIDEVSVDGLDDDYPDSG